MEARKTNKNAESVQDQLDEAVGKAAEIRGLLVCLSELTGEADAGSMAKAAGVATKLMDSLMMDLVNIYIPEGSAGK